MKAAAIWGGGVKTKIVNYGEDSAKKYIGYLTAVIFFIQVALGRYIIIFKMI